jgi:hypothetical protein
MINYIAARLREFSPLVHGSAGADLVNRAADEIERLQAKVSELEKQSARYEYMRRLNVPEFTALYKRNIRGEGRFDDLVDIAIKEMK